MKAILDTQEKDRIIRKAAQLAHCHNISKNLTSSNAYWHQLIGLKDALDLLGFFSRFEMDEHLENIESVTLDDTTADVRLGFGDWELVLVWTDGTRNIYFHKSEEEAERSRENFRISVGDQLSFACVRRRS